MALLHKTQFHTRYTQNEYHHDAKIEIIGHLKSCLLIVNASSSLVPRQYSSVTFPQAILLTLACWFRINTHHQSESSFCRCLNQQLR